MPTKVRTESPRYEIWGVSTIAWPLNEDGRSVRGVVCPIGGFVISSLYKNECRRIFKFYGTICIPFRFG